MLDKKAQIGETITWVVATITIIVILAISIYASSILATKTKVINVKDSLSLDTEIQNILLKESLFAYLLTKDENKKTVYSKIESDEEVDDFIENLGSKIFEVNDEEIISVLIKKNGRIISGILKTTRPKILEKIRINEEIEIEIVSNKKTSQPTDATI